MLPGCVDGDGTWALGAHGSDSGPPALGKVALGHAVGSLVCQLACGLCWWQLRAPRTEASGAMPACGREAA